VVRGSSEGVPDPEEIERLWVQADAGDRNAAGLLGELLAAGGDAEGALRVWVAAYGATSSTTKRLAELQVEDGDLQGAVSTWLASDEVRQNPAGLHQKHLSRLSLEDRLQEEQGDPEDWAYIEAQHLRFALAKRGDRSAIAELRALADAGSSEAALQLRWLTEEH
jgi:hypothetical protein